MSYTTVKREATHEELAHRLRNYLGSSLLKVQFRHFVSESNNPRAANGVSHRQYSSAKVVEMDGKFFVRYHGKLEELTANFSENTCLDDPSKNSTVVWDIRIKSEYLKPL